jgi:uncharacterized protein YoxC
MLICSAIAGIVVGIALMLIGVSVIILIVILKQKRKQQKSQRTYSSISSLRQDFNTNNKEITTSLDKLAGIRFISLK